MITTSVEETSPWSGGNRNLTVMVGEREEKGSRSRIVMGDRIDGDGFFWYAGTEMGDSQVSS